jgi:nucleoside-diphosphate-sugar epimerase
MREGLNQKLNRDSDILVFGASGAIGTAFLEKSKLSGMRVIGVSRGYPKDKSIISTDYRTTSVLEIIKTYTPKQIIISIGTASSNPNSDSTLIKDEFRSIGSIISAIDQSNVSSHVSLLSSSAVYGETKNKLSSESDILNPISKYGESKAKVEELALQHSKNSSFTLDVLRVFSVYGKNQKKLLVWDLFERILKCNEAKLEIKSSAKNKRNFINIEDLASIIQVTADRAESKSRIINIGSPDTLLVRDVVELVRQFLSPNLIVSFTNETEIGKPELILPDLTKMYNLIGAEFNFIDFKDGMNETLQFWRNQNL